HRDAFLVYGQREQPDPRRTGIRGVGQTGLISSGSALDPNVRSTYNQQWNFTIQKKLPKQLYLDVGYVGAKGTDLTVTFDSNRPIQIVTPGPTVPSIASRRPFKGFDAITTTKSI